MDNRNPSKHVNSFISSIKLNETQFVNLGYDFIFHRIDASLRKKIINDNIKSNYF